MECKKENNLKTCPCTYTSCDKRGTCCECIRHHVEKNELPGCCFSKEAEKTYDRSFKKFFEDQGVK
ncbi:DUF6485 family protein [Patescibacteria group bacterium]